MRTNYIRIWLGSIAVLGLVLAACSSPATGTGVATLDDVTSSNAVTDGPETDASLDVESQMLAFAQCMRDQGLDMEDPTVDANGNLGFGGLRGPGQDGEQSGPPDGFREAIDECQPLLEGLELGFGRGDETELRDTLLEFAQCMRDNGYAMDDPDLSTFGPGSGEEPGQRSGPFGDVDFNDPAFQTAQSACEDILGGFGPGGRTTPGANSGQDS